MAVLGLLLVLGGCRSEPGVAAYIDDDVITIEALEAAVAHRLQDPALIDQVEPGAPEYQRLVLTGLIIDRVYDSLAESYDVTVADREVDQALRDLADGGSVDAGLAQLAEDQSLAEADVRAGVRLRLIRDGIAEAEDLIVPIDEDALRERFTAERASLSTINLGYLTVPDVDTAADVLAALESNPGSYPDLAGDYPGEFTLPTLTRSSLADVPGPLVPSILGTVVGQGFILPVDETGGVVVGYIAGLDVPEFDDVRDELAERAEAEAAEQADAAVSEIVTAYLAERDIVVNPRFGVLSEDGVVPVEGGTVDILGD